MKNANVSRNNIPLTRNKINVQESKHRMNNNSLPSLSSTFTTKLRQSRRPCPLMGVKLDYKKLREMAKEVDEKDLCYDTPREIETPKNEESKQLTVWSVHPAKYKRCTCGSKKWYSFDEVVHKFEHSEIDTLQKKLGNRGTYAAPNSTLSRQRTKTWVMSNLNNHSTSIAKSTNKNSATQFENLLKNLENEYFAICSKHHELTIRAKIGNKRVEKSTKLREIEESMFKKEQEIETVMSMYKDLLQLRDEVRKLKQPKQPAVTSVNLPKQDLKIPKPVKSSISNVNVYH